MKNLDLKTVALCAVSLFCCHAGLQAAEENEENEATSAVARRVLVVGMDDNVRSNYYDLVTLSEDSKMNQDSISAIYNNAIETNMRTASQKEKNGLTVIPCVLKNDWKTLLRQVTIKGEDEKAVSDWSNVKDESLKSLMAQANAGYLLVLDTHYLKYQEKPFRTLFHFVNYSLYNSDKTKLTQGSYYFTSFNPQNEKDLIKSSRKSSQKILSDIAKFIEK